ncbi:hypothetical protein SteCoe_18371 [Stentor coeruleus]|uniref:Uncharacterized protein n=1 Tax=Stentor coeruleus TaxID=5963 RepID=A0A1R2BX64_9CILI|nr:hypothetical protein SteCoe_18371 [Stentor coeruleus]
MNESYRNWSEDLFYSTEIIIESHFEPVDNENVPSPMRPARIQSHWLEVTPTRSPLKALQETPLGLRYSPISK